MTTMPPQNEVAGGEAGDRDAQIAALAKQAQALGEGVSALAADQGTAIVGLARRGRSTRRVVTWLGVSLVLDVLLTLAFSYSVFSVNSLSSNTRTQLCGMLQIFVNSDTPKNEALAKARGDDMAVRAASFTLIRHSYNALDCAKLVKK